MTLTEQSLLAFRSVYLSSHNEMIVTFTRSNGCATKELGKQLRLKELSASLHTCDKSSSELASTAGDSQRYSCSFSDIGYLVWS